MRKQLAIFNSDQVSKDGTQFSISALEDGIWLTSLYGVPSNYSHDMHRPIGWSYAKGLYFEPEKVLTIGYFLIVETQDDVDVTTKARKTHFENHVYRALERYGNAFVENLGDLFVKDDGHWFATGTLLYGRPKIVEMAFPKLLEHINNDKDHLVNLEYLLNEFDYLSQGVFKKKGTDLCIMAHPYFRKSVSIHNNFHWIFLDELVNLYSTCDLRIKLKIDLDWVGYAPSFIPQHEYEYWWGPKFDDNITAIPPGLTQFGSDDFERQYYQIDRTEFVWKQDENLYTLELEEVREDPAPTIKDVYACRYVHSIWDKRKNGFDHFDGAIRAYDGDLMLERIGKKMTEMGRRSDYTKLFRIDGNLPLAQWKSLVTNYLQGNPQIYEYFGLPKPAVQALIEPEPEPTAIEKYVPYSINKDEGIRLYVSYQQKAEELDKARYFNSYDVLTLEDGEHKSIEYFTVDVMKVFNSTGAKIDLPKDHLFILHEDYYHNIPCIFHAGDNVQLALNESVKALTLLCKQLMKAGTGDIISFSLAWNMDDHKVNLAAVGHVADLHKWFQSFTSIPVNREKLKDFLEQQTIFIKQNGIPTQTPLLSSIICTDGMLFLNRRLVNKDAEMSWPDPTHPMEISLKIPDESHSLMDALDQKLIYPTPNLVIYKLICKNSGLDYIDSPLCSLLDADVKLLMEDTKMISFHWSDKPRPIAFE
jgi:hypothetical protein